MLALPGKNEELSTNNSTQLDADYTHFVSGVPVGNLAQQ